MHRLKKLLNWGLAVVLLLGGTVVWLAMDADAQQRSRRITVNRAKLWLSTRNNGTAGHSMDGGNWFGPEVGMSYPGQQTPLYFAGIVSRRERNDSSRGNGLWVMAKSSEGDVWVSRGGPREVDPRIAPILRNPRANLEGILSFWRRVRGQGAYPFNFPGFFQNRATWWPRTHSITLKSHWKGEWYTPSGGDPGVEGWDPVSGWVGNFGRYDDPDVGYGPYGWMYDNTVYGGQGNSRFPFGPEILEPQSIYNRVFGTYRFSYEQMVETLKNGVGNNIKSQKTKFSDEGKRNPNAILGQMRVNQRNGPDAEFPGWGWKDIRAPELWGEHVIISEWASPAGITTRRILHAYSNPGTVDGIARPVPTPDVMTDERGVDQLVPVWDVDAHGKYETNVLGQVVYTDGDYDDSLINEITIENTGDIDGDWVADPGFPKMMDEVYIVVKNGFLTGMLGADWVPAGGANSNAWGQVQPSSHDDFWHYTQMPNYLGDADVEERFRWNYRGDPMHLTYVHDGDAVARLWDDYGEPYTRSRAQHQFVSSSNIQDGTLLSPEYIGVVTLATGTSASPFNALDADKGYVLPQGPQPHGVYRWRMFSSGSGEDPDGGTHGERALFDIYSNPDLDPDFSGNLEAVNEKRFPFVHDNEEIAAWVDAMVFGPYTLAPGDKAKVVFAYVAATPAQSEKYRTDKVNKYTQPFEWEWQEGASSRARSTASLAPANPRDELHLGHEALWHNANEAQKLYDLGFDGINNPPDPKLEGGVFTNMNGNLEITWSGQADTAIDPDLARPDVVGWRVYRSDYQRFGPWRILADIKKAVGPSGNKKLPAGSPLGAAYYNDGWREPGDPTPSVEDIGEIDETSGGFTTLFERSRVGYKWGRYSYEDANPANDPPVPGFKVQYTVRAYDEQGLETGHADERNQYPFLPNPGGHIRRVVATSATDNMEKQIRVVPNPWVQGSDDFSYGEQRIRWINVPSRCRLYIYTLTGDLIWRETFDTKDPARVWHRLPPSSDIAWDTATANLNINTRGRLNAGTYIWVIESLHPEAPEDNPSDDKGSFGKTQKGLFVVVN